MYRVNAERSQEKNDRNESMHRCTKVTCATLARRKSSPDITTHSLVISHHVVFAAPVFQRTPSAMLAGCAARTFAKLSAIYNERRFSATMLEEARLKSASKETRERNHGRI